MPFLLTMLLDGAFELQPGDIVAAVGAGGKTAILSRLAGELAAHGHCVLSTTTTHIWQPAGPCIVEADEAALIAAVTAAVRPGRVITVAAEREFVADPPGVAPRPKLVGVQPHLPGRLQKLDGVAHVLVEADGAHGRAIKAPAEHEPVIPPSATVVVAVVGIDAVGQPLGKVIAHRPERLSALLRIEPGTILTPQHITALFEHPQGGRKGVPPLARFVVFINKVENETHLATARAIAAPLCRRSGIDRVVIGAAHAPQPVIEVWPS